MRRLPAAALPPGPKPKPPTVAVDSPKRGELKLPVGWFRNAVAQAKICWTDFYEFVPGLFTGRVAHERGLIAKSDCNLIAGGCGDDRLSSGRLEVSDGSN